MKSQSKEQNMPKSKAGPEQGRRVFVGLSGGVDSAVSAALLKEQGYDVSGVFIKAWSPEWMDCTWKEDRRSAMRVCAVLDIPFFTLDLEKEYKEEVVDYMIREYKEGKTPNPDVMCNKEIKFGAFLKWALEKGADYVATGHYARIGFASPVVGEVESEASDEVLLEGLDKNKDQSYFLWTLTKEQLKHVLFPIGDLQKPEVRKIADKFNLPQATRKDSQGLCFLGQVDMKEFLKHYIETKRGDVLSESGEVVGFHDGALFFTLGERHGFTILSKTDSDEPFYVVGKDIEKNTVTVSSKNTVSKMVRGSSLYLIDVNWNNDSSRSDLDEVECRFRYRQDKVKCKIKENEGKLFVEFENISDKPASGQSIVFYDGEVCLGGAIIV